MNLGTGVKRLQAYQTDTHFFCKTKTKPRA